MSENRNFISFNEDTNLGRVKVNNSSIIHFLEHSRALFYDLKKY